MAPNGNDVKPHVSVQPTTTILPRTPMAGWSQIRLATAVALSLLASGCGSAPGVATRSASTNPDTNSAQLVFAAAIDDNQDLYLKDLATGRLTRLTRDKAPDGAPVWSPDGSRLAFIRFADDGSSEIHIMNADGTEDRQLTDRAGAMQILPTWSPDGSQIAFARVIGNGGMASDSEIFTIHADGSGLRQLTLDPEGRPNDPAWSPDGSLIAFDAGDPKPALHVMNADGTGRRRLTLPDAQTRIDWPLLWSSDSSALAFAGTGPSGQRDVYVVGRDGAQLLDLTGEKGNEGPPAWSPDGRRLAFWSDRDGVGDIYVVDRNGGSATRLTTGSRLSGVVTLAWSPDGRRLVVWNSHEGQVDKNYLLDAGGGHLQLLTSERGNEDMALWRPPG